MGSEALSGLLLPCLQGFRKTRSGLFHSKNCSFIVVISRANLLGALGEMNSTRNALVTIQERKLDPLSSSAQEVDHCSTTGRLLVVEEHQLLAAGLQLALSQRHWQVETDSASTVSSVIEHARRFEPHCVLIDTQLRNGVGSAIPLIEPLTAIGACAVILTAERRRTVLAEYLEAGAVGWISMHTPLDELDEALGRVLSGDSIIGRTERSQLLEDLRLERRRIQEAEAIFEQLTQRESLVLAALSDGLTAEEIARAHYVALTTVRSQIRAVLQKLGVRSQLAAVAVADAHRELLPYELGSSRDRRRVKPAAQSRNHAVLTA